MCRQGFVGRHDDCRGTQPRNHVCHGVGLAGAGYTQQGLIRQAIAQPFGEFLNGLRLVAGGLKGLMQTVRTIRKGQYFDRLVAGQRDHICGLSWGFHVRLGRVTLDFRTITLSRANST